jgi:hypothetical protein
MIMKTRYSSFVIFITLLLLTASCNLPSRTEPPTPDTVATIVAGTMGALTTQTVSDTPTVTVPIPTIITFTPIPLSTPTTFATITPSSTPTTAVTGTPSPTATPGMGSISGGVYGYPYGTIPSLTFVAFSQETYHWLYWINLAGASYYVTDVFIPAGKYQVVAYDAAGHVGGCVTIITVKANETAICDITDWIVSS